MNKWNIPDWLEREAIERDRRCVYCGVEFEIANAPRASQPTWEHIINDARVITRANIARCCVSCNSSKGAKTLADWLSSKYCVQRGISAHSVAEVVKVSLACPLEVQTCA